MTDPIEYQTPLPPGRRLRFLESEGALRISRDAVSRFALWREASLPALSVVSFLIPWVVSILLAVHYAHLVPLVATPVFAIILILMSLGSIRAFRDSWQNMGIVTEIAVSGETFYWRKQNLWGSREYFWPLASMDRAEVSKVGRILKVYRARGTPLGAFAYFSVQELELAAASLNRAILQGRDLK